MTHKPTINLDALFKEALTFQPGDLILFKIMTAKEMGNKKTEGFVRLAINKRGMGGYFIEHPQIKHKLMAIVKSLVGFPAQAVEIIQGRQAIQAKAPMMDMTEMRMKLKCLEEWGNDPYTTVSSVKEKLKELGLDSDALGKMQ